MQNIILQGKCSYYLVKAENFSIEAENVACPGSISEDLFFGPSGVDLPSCTKSVTINVINGDKIKSVKLKQGRQILIDGLEIEQLPIKLLEGVLRVKQASSTMILVTFYDGLKVWWDGTSRVYIDAPPEYRGKTKGLCGTFSSNIQDDFLTPEGDIESSVISFANKWRTKETCQYVSDGFVPHPCHLNIENKELAIKTCAKLKEEVFADCHWSVDVSSFLTRLQFNVKIFSCCSFRLNRFTKIACTIYVPVRGMCLNVYAPFSLHMPMNVRGKESSLTGDTRCISVVLKRKFYASSIESQNFAFLFCSCPMSGWTDIRRMW